MFGFKAPSPLLRLPSFDIVNGIGIDAMHCIFLGVVKQLVGLWFDSKHSGQTWYCGRNVAKVDQRLTRKGAKEHTTSFEILER